MKSRRNTSQRAIVLSVAKQMYHPSAEEVYAEVKKTESGVGRATVFRNLNLLAEEGEFMKVCFQGEPTRFDTNAKSHDHFVCKRCGKITGILRNSRGKDFTQRVNRLRITGYAENAATQSFNALKTRTSLNAYKNSDKP